MIEKAEQGTIDFEAKRDQKRSWGGRALIRGFCRFSDLVSET